MDFSSKFEFSIMGCFKKVSTTRKFFVAALIFFVAYGAVFAKAKNSKNSTSAIFEPTFVHEDKSEVSKAELKNGDAEKNVSLSKVKEIVQSLQKMEGIQYYSNNDKKWETLYHKCCFLDNLESKNPIEPKIDENVDGKSAYFYQEDNSFGDCYYNVTYKETENKVAVFFELADYIKYGPIKAIKPGELKISFFVTDLGESYDVYILAEARFSQVSFLEKRIGKSIANRVEAIKTWFLKEV